MDVNYNPKGDIVKALERPWIFDDNYCVDISGKLIPKGAKTRHFYENQDQFLKNEKFENDWILSLVSDSNGEYNDRFLYENYRWSLFEERQAMFVDLQQTKKQELVEGKFTTLSVDNPSVNPGYSIINIL